MSQESPQPPGRTHESLRRQRAAEVAVASQRWSEVNDNVTNTKEEHIRGAINTVTMQGVLHSPMKLEETDRQRRQRQQDAFAAHYASFQQQQPSQLISSQRRKSGAAYAMSVEVSSQQRDPQHQQKIRLSVDGTPAATGGSISRPDATHIPSPMFTRANTQLGRCPGGGGSLGPSTIRAAASKQLSWSGRLYPTTPMYSSFHKDGVYREAYEGKGKALLVAHRKEQLAAEVATRREEIGADRSACCSALSMVTALLGAEGRGGDGCDSGRESVTLRRQYHAASAASGRTPRDCETSLSHYTRPDSARVGGRVHGHNAVAQQRPATAGSQRMSYAASARRASTSAVMHHSDGAGAVAAVVDDMLQLIPTPPPSSLHRHAVNVSTHEGMTVTGHLVPPEKLVFRSPQPPASLGNNHLLESMRSLSSTSIDGRTVRSKDALIIMTAAVGTEVTLTPTLVEDGLALSGERAVVTLTARPNAETDDAEQILTPTHSLTSLLQQPRYRSTPERVSTKSINTQKSTISAPQRQPMYVYTPAAMMPAVHSRPVTSLHDAMKAVDT